MKNFTKKIVLLVMMCMMTVVAASAQEALNVEIKVKELVKKYENVKGVECITLGRGIALGMVKSMLNQQYGKDFMKGVTSITIINYTSASQETCVALRKDIDAFGSILQEFKIGEEKEPTNSYARSFASISEDNAISDFITAMEDAETKMMMYMAGKIKVE